MKYSASLEGKKIRAAFQAAGYLLSSTIMTLPAGDDVEDPRLYIRTARLVRQQIADGGLKPGERAPSITALCRETRQSRQTAAKALQLLEREKLLKCIPGLGYIVDDDAIAHLPQPPD